MTHIAEATAIQSPPERSRAYLLSYVSRLPKSRDGRAVVRLGAGPTSGGLRLEHDVEAELKPADDEKHLEYRVALSWRPTGTTLLPSFSGVLRFQWDEDYGYTWLVLEGDYEPPLGAAGKAFDAIAGERIARGTMRALLDDLREVLESAHARELGTGKS
jgi:hypothetical protein